MSRYRYSDAPPAVAADDVYVQPETRLPPGPASAGGDVSGSCATGTPSAPWTSAAVSTRQASCVSPVAAAALAVGAGVTAEDAEPEEPGAEPGNEHAPSISRAAMGRAAAMD